MLKSKNLKIGTSSKAQFTLTVRTVSVYIAKANVLFILLCFFCFDGRFVYFIVVAFLTNY